MKDNTRARRRGTEVPEWLKLEWKRIDGAPQSETIEARALCLIRDYADKEKWLKARPHLLQALALDLMWASYNPPKHSGSDAVKWLMVLALGLPPEHEPGNWMLHELDTRGKPDREARTTARLIANAYLRDHGEKIPKRALAKLLKAEGFKTSTSTIRKWAATSSTFAKLLAEPN